MEYIPDNLYRYNRRFVRAHTLLPLIYVKVPIASPLLFLPPAVHLPDVQRPRLHPLTRHLPPRHQTAERAHRPQDACDQDLRLRQREAPVPERAQRLLHLLALLPRAGADLRRDELHGGGGHLEHGVRRGGASDGLLAVPWREQRGTDGGDHQGAGDAHGRAGAADESELQPREVSEYRS